MKITLVTAAANVLVIGTVIAGPETIVRERAKELSNQNNVRQGVAPPTQPQQPAPAPTTSPGTPAPAAPQKSQAVLQFETDLGAIKSNDSITPAIKQKLATDILAIAEGTKPAATAAAKLAEDLATAASVKPLDPKYRSRLGMELDAILNPAKYPKSNPAGIFSDIQATFQANGSDRKQAVAISEDVKGLR
jgi:hypothetical protein